MKFGLRLANLRFRLKGVGPGRDRSEDIGEIDVAFAARQGVEPFRQDERGLGSHRTGKKDRKR